LLVEDDADVRAYVAETLTELGYKVLEADCADRALAAIKTNGAIDLLLTDVMLPDLNGRQLADRVRHARPKTKVLFMTGYPGDAIIYDGRIEAGMEVVQKPVDVATLSTKIRNVLDGELLVEERRQADFQ
jgi:DNA-binding response OmpR family regulator